MATCNLMLVAIFTICAVLCSALKTENIKEILLLLKDVSDMAMKEQIDLEDLGELLALKLDVMAIQNANFEPPKKIDNNRMNLFYEEKIGTKVTVEEIKIKRRGLFAKKKLDSGDLIAKIPAEMAISAANHDYTCFRLKSRPGTKFHDPWRTAKLALAILEAKKSSESTVNLHFGTFPSQLKHPLLLDEEQVVLLGETATRDTVVRNIADFMGLYAFLWTRLSLCKIGLTKEDLSLEAFQWAYVNALTRGVAFEGLDELYIIPGADIINHESGSPNAVVTADHTEGTFLITATAEIKAGTEITRSYHPILTLSDSFAFYGFRDDRYHSFKVILGEKDKKRNIVAESILSPLLICFQNPFYHRLNRFFSRGCGLAFEEIIDIANGKENTLPTTVTLGKFYDFIRDQIQKNLKVLLSDEEITTKFNDATILTKMVLREVALEKKILSNGFMVSNHATRNPDGGYKCIGKSLTHVWLPDEEKDDHDDSAKSKSSEKSEFMSGEGKTAPAVKGTMEHDKKVEESSDQGVSDERGGEKTLTKPNIDDANSRPDDEL